MRIAWFTAYSTRSGISEFSRRVTPALAVHVDVDIWTGDDPPLHDSDLPVVRFGGEAELEAALLDYDIVVYNMGNTLRSHREMHEISKRHPGIVILHDRVLHPMFVAKWWCDGGFMDPMYVSRMAAYYGEAGARVARDSISRARPVVWESDEVVEYPLAEEALQRALGAVTHSEGHARYIQSRWLGPVRALQLPAYRDALAKGALAGPRSPTRADGRVQLTTIGHVTANKQIHRVIRVLAGDTDLAARAHYTIVGALEEGNSYASDLLGLLRSVPHVSAEMLGWRDEEELDRLMGATDVFVNLRHPTIEGGSASLMRELAFGRAVLCFDAGAFAELPPDAAARVPAGDFDAAGSELRRLVTDANYRFTLGEAARRVASERSEAAYAQAFLEFVAEAQHAAPTLTLLDRVATELGVMRADPRLPVFDTIASDFGRILAL